MMVSILLVITALGLIVLGIVPGVEELWRIFIYLIISIIYISFWLGIAILFSIFLRSSATSAQAALAVWIFFSFFCIHRCQHPGQCIDTVSRCSQSGRPALARQACKSLFTYLTDGAVYGCDCNDYRSHAKIRPRGDDPGPDGK